MRTKNSPWYLILCHTWLSDPFFQLGHKCTDFDFIYSMLNDARKGFGFQNTGRTKMPLLHSIL